MYGYIFLYIFSPRIVLRHYKGLHIEYVEDDNDPKDLNN